MARIWRLSEDPRVADWPRARTHARSGAPPRVGGAEAQPTDTAGKRKSWLLDHPREAAFGAGVLASAAAVRMAGAPPLVALAAVPVGALAALLWRRRGYPQHRPKLEVVDGCHWPNPWRWDAWIETRQIKRESARLLSTWDAVAEASGVKGAKLRKVVHDPEEGYSVHVEAYGKLATDVRLPRFHSAAGIAVEWTVETSDLARPWEFVAREAVRAAPPADAEDEPEAEAETAWSPPPPIDQHANRVAALHVVVERLGPEVVSAAELGRRAGNIPRDWMAKHITKLAPELGLRRATGGWVRLAIAAGEER